MFCISDMLPCPVYRLDGFPARLVWCVINTSYKSDADYGYGFAPLAPQVWGEQDFQSPPKLGDLGGLTKTR
ncbi:MAG: hypothetical protein F6K65_35135 [Moorea sp. SIO3C2]|nr:hypothetical protein [Moorena sp. SIO3C2]